MSYLGIEGRHASVTGARGGIGQAIVEEFLSRRHSTSSVPTATSTDPPAQLLVAESPRTTSNLPPYFSPATFPSIPQNDYSPHKKAATWMHPSPRWSDLPKSDLVEIPLNWHQEDATPLQFYPHTMNSAGYVDVRVVERMWRDKVGWLRNERDEGGVEEELLKVLAVVLHPDTAGMSHVIGMVERFLRWVLALEDVEVCRYEDIAEEYRALMAGKR